MQEVSVITSRQNVVLDTLVSKDDVLHFNQYMEKALRYPKTDLDSNKNGGCNTFIRVEQEEKSPAESG